MAVPYEFPFVEAEIGPRLKIVGDEQETRENSFKALNDACVKIRAESDTHWGLLKKTGGVNAFGYAADVWLYDFGDGSCQVVDVIANSEGAPPPEGGSRQAPVSSWGEKDIRSVSEWAEPLPPYETDGGTDGGDDLASLQIQVDALTADVNVLSGDVATLQHQYTDLLAQWETAISNGLHAHGPVDLPIVVENWDRMRAKGDIDVTVIPGTAVPPTPSDETFNAIDLKILKKLIEKLKTK